MSAGQITVQFAPELSVFVTAARRNGPTAAHTDGTSSLGHVVESLGVPLTEVGQLAVDGRAMPASHLPVAGAAVTVGAIGRPQPLADRPRFLLDVHLGTLTRRLRLLGIDAAYENPDIGDAALATRSAQECRVLLSRDRGLLRRREIFAGAYVYSHRPMEQLDDVLSRFAPALAPWTRCTACNGALCARNPGRPPVPADIGRDHDTVAQCLDCGRTFWRGAHYARLDAIVARAQRTVGAQHGTATVHDPGAVAADR